MSDNYKLIQEIIAKMGYKVLDDDGETITVFFQLNVIHICPDEQDGGFVTVFTTLGETITQESRVEALEKCNRLNSKIKVMKFCIFDDDVLASSEFFFRNKNEVKFQLTNALSQTAMAKSLYNDTRV